MLEYVGLPKVREVQDWAGFRWIGKAPSLQKAYLRMITEEVKRRRAPYSKYPVILGFREGCSVAMITDLVAELLRFGDVWGVPVL
eukprot:5415448-Lingulodinium_polyedra.AAC.1